MKTYDELKALIEQRGVHGAFGAAGEGYGIEQNSHELATFLVKMQALGVQSVLEIGTGYRGGLSRFLAAEMGWQVTSIDIQDYGHSFAGIEYVILAKNNWTPTQYDLVFIDGNHLYPAVMSDYYCYKEHAKKVIAFHDIGGMRDCEGVRQFWNEIARTPEWEHNRGFYDIYDQSSAHSGIGYIGLSETT